MAATNHNDQRHDIVKFIQRCRKFGDFLKVCCQFFTFSLLWPSWFVAVVVCGRRGIGPNCPRDEAVKRLVDMVMLCWYTV